MYEDEEIEQPVEDPNQGWEAVLAELGVKPVQVADSEVPPCFPDKKAYEQWLGLDEACGVPTRREAGYCVDCAPEYQHKMMLEGRCLHPDVRFHWVQLGKRDSTSEERIEYELQGTRRSTAFLVHQVDMDSYVPGRHYRVGQVDTRVERRRHIKRFPPPPSSLTFNSREEEEEYAVKRAATIGCTTLKRLTRLTRWHTAKCRHVVKRLHAEGKLPPGMEWALNV